MEALAFPNARSATICHGSKSRHAQDVCGTPSKPGQFAGNFPATSLLQPGPLQMFPVGALLLELVTAAVQRHLLADHPSCLCASERLQYQQPTAGFIRLIHHIQLRFLGFVRSQAPTPRKV